MEIAWLESLAGRLRSVLAQHGVAVPHDEARDLVAAVAQSRAWSELTASPGRLADCRFDEHAVERIAQRVNARHRLSINAPMFALSLRRMSLLYRPSTSTGTQRLIVTSSDAGAGHLMRARIADQVEVTDPGDPLVFGPVPPGSGPEAFYRAREAACDRDPSIAGDLWPWNRAEPALTYWNELLTLCEIHERIELWIDPGPDAQLQLIRLLDWLSAHRDLIGKLYVVHADGDLGERSADDFRTTAPRIDAVDGRHLRLARRVWDAYRRSTPVAWFDLLVTDLDVLPHLRRTVLLLLDELPGSTTGLSATERLLLEVVEPGDVEPSRVSFINAQRDPARVFGAFDAYRIVVRLARCAVPVIKGLQAAAAAMTVLWEDEPRKAYSASKLSLSDLGRALLAGQDDFARHNRIERWWGGTLLTNSRLWRWDAARRRLVAPA